MRSRVCKQCHIQGTMRLDRTTCDKCRNSKYQGNRIEKRTELLYIECNKCHVSKDKSLMLIDSNRCKTCQVEYRKSLDSRTKCKYCLKGYENVCRLCSRIKSDISDDKLFETYIRSLS